MSLKPKNQFVKTFAAITLITLIFQGNLLAQDFSYGIKGGPNFSGLSGMVNVEIAYRKSLNLGVFVNLGNEKFQFQPEILYSGQGSTVIYRESGNPTSATTGETTVKLNYINFPLIGKLFLGNSFNLQFGPQFGFLLSSKEEGEVDGVKIDQENFENIKSTAISLATGIGAQFTENVFFDIRLNIGLSDLYKVKGEIFPGEEWPKLTNVLWQFSVGIKL